MAWYRGGTVAVTNGSTTVTGTNTDFVSNVGNGHGFLGPDGRTIEIAAVVSATQLTLASPYQGATASGQSYSILPTTSYAIDLAIQAATLINAFGAIRDGIGQGLIPAGTVTAPGLRFSADQDTGIRRSGENALSVVIGGTDGFNVASNGATIARSGVVQLILQNSGGQTRNAQVVFAGSDNNPWRIGSDVSTNNGSDNFQIFKDSLGTAALTIVPSGYVGIGTTSPGYRTHIRQTSAVWEVLGLETTTASMGCNIVFKAASQTAVWDVGLYGDQGGWGVRRAASKVFTIDDSGNVLINATSGSAHHIGKQVGQGTEVLGISNAGFGYITARFYSVGSTNLGAASDAALRLGTNPTTNRSLNAGGTINASGADYAEYMRKAASCGSISKGDVCGVDRSGELVKTWAGALRFVVKSTDPNLVGGDVWSAHLGDRPPEPIYEPPAYDGPAEPVRPDAPAPFVMPVIALPEQPNREEGEDDETFITRMAAYLVERSAALAAIAQAGEAEVESAAAQARYTAAVRQYEGDLAAYDAAQRAYDDVEAAAGAAHDEAMAKHAAELAAWEADLEAARRTVDRIAFCGQVPVNVDADTLAACEAALADGVAVYLVAVARGAGIGVAAVREGDMTLAQYMRRVGCVWAIRDGRPWVDVQHG